MRIATVVADGLNIRSHPRVDSFKAIDSLTVGDEITLDATTKPVEGWHYGRISKIANRVYGAERTQRSGWFYAKGTVTFRDVPDPKPDPAPVVIPKPMPAWGMWAIAAFIILLVAATAYWR